MQNLLAQLQGMGGGGGGMAQRSDEPLRDTAETIHISSLALLKMLIHGRAGVPLEVMGLMIGEYLDEYTVRVTDVFSMPQTATGQSVEAVDDEYQSQMLEKLELVGRPEKVVGWYHSHPGFGCWLSMEDVMTAKSYEQLTPRSVSVVVDPIQSVRGKVVIDAFRTIPEAMAMMATEPRQTTSNTGFLCRPTAQAVAQGLGRHYYNMPIAYRKHEHEVRMLLNVHRKGWQEGLRVEAVEAQRKDVTETLHKIRAFALQTEKFITSGQDEDDIGNVGKLNPAIHLQQEAETLLATNLNNTIGTMINAIVF
jgi:26S proteasome regulatory subunit N11